MAEIAVDLTSTLAERKATGVPGQTTPHVIARETGLSPYHFLRTFNR